MENRINKRKTGAAYERRAADFLKNEGLVILEMNYHLKCGEIDIIALDQDTYVFTEVKYRKSTSHGYPNEAITYSKQKAICRVATMYKKIKKLPDTGSFRFDVVTILNDKIVWYKNAFEYHV